MAKVLIASDKFKGSLTAAQVAVAVADGVRRVRPDVEIASVAVADGGDGTLAAAEAAGFARVEVTVTGPTGEPVRTAYARRGDVAVVELADASGLVRLPAGPDPLGASSIGTGEGMAAALDADTLRSAGIRAAYALTDVEPDVRRCLAYGARLLVELGERIAHDHLPAPAAPRPSFALSEESP
jgi:glycerate kinase